MPSKKKSARKPARKAAGRKSAKKSARKAASRKPARRPAARRPAAPKAPPAPPNSIGLMNHHLDYTTHNLEGVKRFYTDLLGFREFTHDAGMNYLMVRTGTSSSLGFMPPMPGMEMTPPMEPGLYFMVKDVDRAYSNLASKGVSFDKAPEDMPWGHRVAVTRDPEGRKVYLATVKTS
jgi:predicted enzyme related to lactoylglutathione lyase